MRMLAVALLTIVASLAGAARAAPASPESVDRLMQAMQVQSQLETMYAQVLPSMQASMRQTLATQLKSEEAARIYGAVQERVNAVILEQLSWARLKPGFARIYAEAFSQEEVNGLIAFYEGPYGTAMVRKSPQLIERSLQMMQQSMGPMLQQVMQITREEIEKERSRGVVRN